MLGKWRTLLAVSIVGAMQLFDVGVVNVALPDIERDLDASFNELRWVIDATALTLAASVLIFGSLGDRVGRRRVFLVGLVSFSLASLACALAWSAVALVVLRGVQGVAGGAMLATALALVGAVYSGRDRNTALGIWGVSIGVALAIGPLIGGALVELAGWRAVFLLNVPLGLSAALVGRGVPESRDPSASGAPDFAGLVTIAGSMTLMLLALFRGNEEGWGSSLILGLFAGSAALLVAFVAIESRVAHPLLDLGLFRRPSTTGAAIGIFSIAASVFALLTFLVFYIQNALGHSPLETGLILIPLSAASLVGAWVAGRLANRFPLGVLLSSALVVAGVGMLLLRNIDPDSEWTALLAGGIISELGTGAVSPFAVAVALGAASRARSGMASGLNNTFRYLGLAVGVAALGTLLESRVGDRLVELLPAAAQPESLAAVAATGNIEATVAAAPAAFGPEVAEAAKVAFVFGMDEIFLAGALISFAGAAIALLCVRGRDLDRESVVR